MNEALDIMRGLNANCFVALEADHFVLIEDHTDPDGRMYRMEYRSSPDGRHALAFCLHNPWSGEGQGPNACASIGVAHVASDGWLCLGSVHVREVSRSPYDLKTAVSRGRYWCTAFSVLKESGRFPDP